MEMSFSWDIRACYIRSIKDVSLTVEEKLNDSTRVVSIVDEIRDKEKRNLLRFDYHPSHDTENSLE